MNNICEIIMNERGIQDAIGNRCETQQMNVMVVVLFLANPNHNPDKKMNVIQLK